MATDIRRTQPNLLASVLVQNRLGTSNEDLDLLLNILFVCYEAVRSAGIELPMISEQPQKTCLARVVGRAQFMEGLSSELRLKALDDQVISHSESNLLALAILELHKIRHAKLESDAGKYFTMAAINLAVGVRVETVAAGGHPSRGNEVQTKSPIITGFAALLQLRGEDMKPT